MSQLPQRPSSRAHVDDVIFIDETPAPMRVHRTRQRFTAKGMTIEEVLNNAQTGGSGLYRRSRTKPHPRLYVETKDEDDTDTEDEGYGDSDGDSDGDYQVKGEKEATAVAAVVAVSSLKAAVPAPTPSISAHVICDPNSPWGRQVIKETEALNGLLDLSKPPATPQPTSAKLATSSLPVRPQRFYFRQRSDLHRVEIKREYTLAKMEGELPKAWSENPPFQSH